MNIIFFNTVALGDYLVHSRLIKDLKLKYNCHISAVCSSYNSRIIRRHKHIDEIIIYDENWSLNKKIKTLKKILKRRYYLSIVFDCKKFSMLGNFLVTSKYKRGVLMQKYKKIFSFKFYLYYPSKLISFFLYDKFVVHKRVKYIDNRYYLPSTWIDLLSDFKINTSKKNIYYFNPKKIYENKKNHILNKIKFKNYFLFHLDHKWEDIKDIDSNLYFNLLKLNSKSKKNIILTTFNNKSKYFFKLEKEINIYNCNNNKILKRNNKKIFLIKNPDIFLQERLISCSDLNISCHSGILVHGSGANKKKLIDILNYTEIMYQSCWAPPKQYHVIKKSTKSKKISLNSIFDQIYRKQAIF